MRVTHTSEKSALVGHDRDQHVFLFSLEGQPETVLLVSSTVCNFFFEIVWKFFFDTVPDCIKLGAWLIYGLVWSYGLSIFGN